MSTGTDWGALARVVGGLARSAVALVVFLLPGVVTAGLALGALTLAAQVDGLAGPRAFVLAHTGRALVIILGSIGLAETVRRQVTP